jgi:HSP20 family protein
MAEKKDVAVMPRQAPDPFALLRQMTAELDHVFNEPPWGSFRWPSFGMPALPEAAAWAPRVDVFEKDNRLITRVDLPGVKKEDVSVEVTDGHLALSGERKRESEEKKDNVYRTEREYGSFYRAVPLPDGVTLENVKATFADGVLEVSVPLPARPQVKARKVEIEAPAKGAKTVP